MEDNRWGEGWKMYNVKWQMGGGMEDVIPAVAEPQKPTRAMAGEVYDKPSLKPISQREIWLARCKTSRR
jgi:hypothetical protein